MLETIEAISFKDAIDYFKRKGYVVDPKRSKVLRKSVGMRIKKGFKLSPAKDGLYQIVYYEKDK